MMFHTSDLSPIIGNFTHSDHLAQLSPQTSTLPVPFGLRAKTATAKILYTSSTQTQEPISTTTPIIGKSPSPPSATNNRAHTGTITKYASGSQGKLGEKTTRASTSPDPKHFYPKSVGLNTTNTPSLNLHNWSSLLSSPLSLHQPQTHLEFPHSNFQKPVLALQPHRSVSDEAGHTHARRPLQRLFRPYPKPTPHPHPYLRLRPCNPYYVIKSTFDMSTNPTLRHLYKPTFWHRHNQLRPRLTSINIRRWIPIRLCRLSPPSRTTLPRSLPTSTSLYKTLLLSTFLLWSHVLNHTYNARQRIMERRRQTLEDF